MYYSPACSHGTPTGSYCHHCFRQEQYDRQVDESYRRPVGKRIKSTKKGDKKKDNNKI